MCSVLSTLKVFPRFGFTLWVSPAELRWTHNKIQRLFSYGRRLQDVAASLQHSVEQPSELPMIGIVRREMKWYSRNNPRAVVWCFTVSITPPVARTVFLVVLCDRHSATSYFSTDLISDGEQTKFGNKKASASAASTVFDPSRVCVNASTGEPVQRDRERKKERKSSHCSVSELTHNSSVVSVEGSMSRGKRYNYESETMKDRQNLHEFLERRAHTAILGENAAQRKLTEAESDMEF